MMLCIAGAIVMFLLSVTQSRMYSFRYAHFSPILNVVLAPKGESILSVGKDEGLIYESSVKTMEEITDNDLTQISESLITSIAPGAAENSILFATNDDSGISSFTLPGLRKNLVFQSVNKYKMITSSHSRKYVAATGESNVIDVFSSEKGQIGCINTSEEVTMLKFSPSGSFLAAYEESNGLSIFETETQDLILNKNVRCQPASISWARGNILLVANPESTNSILLFSPEKGKEETVEIPFHNDIIRNLTISIDGTLVTIDTSNKLVSSTFEHTSKSTDFTLVQTFQRKSTENITFLEFIDQNLCIGEEMGNIEMWNVKGDSTKDTAGEQNEMELDSENDEMEHKAFIVKKPKQKTKADLISKKSSFPFVEKKKKKPKVMPNTHEEGSSDIVDFSKLDEEEDEEDEDDESGIYSTAAKEVPLNMISSSESEGSEAEMAKRMRKELYEEPSREARKEKFAEYQSRITGESIIDDGSSYSSETGSSDDDIVTDKPKTKKQNQEEIDKLQARIMKRQKESKHDEEEEMSDGLINDGDNLNESSGSYSGSSSSSGSEDAAEVTGECFMPGSSIDYKDNRKFLCWNSTGVIFLRMVDEDAESTAIDIEFADKYANRDLFLNNEKNFVLATLNQKGFVGASRTLLQYKCHGEQTSDSEFTFRFGTDTIDLVALGNNWVAVVTKKRILRIFSSSGLEIATISMTSPIVTMVGQNNRLFIVYGEKLEYSVLDVYNRTLLAKGYIPCAPPLKWVSFDEDENAFALGSDLILMELVFDFGFHWVPMLNIRQILTSGEFNSDESSSDSEDLGLPKDENDFHVEQENKVIYDTFWCVSVSENKLYGVFLKGEKVPHVNPLPSLVGLPLQPLTIETGAQSWLSLNYAFSNSSKAKKEECQVRIDTELVKRFSNILKEEEDYYKAFKVAQTIKTPNARSCVIMLAENHESSEPENHKVFVKTLKEYYDSKAQDEEEEIDEAVMQNVEASAEDNGREPSTEEIPPHEEEEEVPAEAEIAVENIEEEDKTEQINKDDEKGEEEEQQQQQEEEEEDKDSIVDDDSIVEE